MVWLVALVPLLFQSLPDDGEGETLEAVCDNASSETSTEEASKTVCVKDHLDSLGIRDNCLACLLCGLDDAQAVTATIGYDGGGETDEGIAAELLESFVGFGLGDVLLKGVEGEEPWETGSKGIGEGLLDKLL